MYSDGGYVLSMNASTSQSPVSSDYASAQIAVSRSNSGGGTNTYSSGNCGNFTDVSPSSSLCPAISFVTSHGIFGGYGDGTLKTNRVISRSEILSVIQKAFGYTLDSYNRNIDGNLGYRDLNTNLPYMPYFKTFIRLNLMKGYPDGTMRPDRTMNTAELYLVFLKAAVQSPRNSANFSLDSSVKYPPFNDTPLTADTRWYIKYAAFAKLNGLVTTANFYPDRGITRGQVIQLIYDTFTKGLISYN